MSQSFNIILIEKLKTNKRTLGTNIDMRWAFYGLDMFDLVVTQWAFRHGLLFKHQRYSP